MISFDPITNGTLLTLVAIAAATDLHNHRIPNWLVATALLLALPLQTYLHGLGVGTSAWALGALTGLAPLLVAYLLRAVGAGDAKLMAAIGAFVGPHAVLQIVLATFLVGGLMALAVMLSRKQTRQALANLTAQFLWLPMAWHGPASGSDIKIEKTYRLPYAVAIAGGVLLVMTDTL